MSEEGSLLNILKNNDAIRFLAKAEYFRVLSANVAKGPCQFEDDDHEFIMRKRSEGFPILKIVRLLAEQGVEIHRHTVSFIIRRYEHKWKIRKWTKKQRHLKNSKRSTKSSRSPQLKFPMDTET